MRLKTRILFSVIIFLIMAGVAEFMAYLKARQLVGYSIGFNPLITTESYKDYQARHHPRLGWTPAPEQVDAVGSRPIPAFHDPLITTACVSLYGDSFTKRNKQPLVLIIPTHFDIAHYRRTGAWVYQPLIDILAKQGVAFLDAGPLFVNYLGDANLETLYSPAIQNHLNEAGNGLLAKIVYEHVTQKDFLKKNGQLSQVRMRPGADLPE